MIVLEANTRLDLSRTGIPTYKGQETQGKVATELRPKI